MKKQFSSEQLKVIHRISVGSFGCIREIKSLWEYADIVKVRNPLSVRNAINYMNALRDYLFELHEKREILDLEPLYSTVREALKVIDIHVRSLLEDSRESLNFYSSTKPLSEWDVSIHDIYIHYSEKKPNTLFYEVKWYDGTLRRHRIALEEVDDSDKAEFLLIQDAVKKAAHKSVLSQHMLPFSKIFEKREHIHILSKKAMIDYYGKWLRCGVIFLQLAVDEVKDTNASATYAEWVKEYLQILNELKSLGDDEVNKPHEAMLTLLTQEENKNNISPFCISKYKNLYRKKVHGNLSVVIRRDEEKYKSAIPTKVEEPHKRGEAKELFSPKNSPVQNGSTVKNHLDTNKKSWASYFSSFFSSSSGSKESLDPEKKPLVTTKLRTEAALKVT